MHRQKKARGKLLLPGFVCAYALACQAGKIVFRTQAVSSDRGNPEWRQTITRCCIDFDIKTACSLVTAASDAVAKAANSENQGKAA